MLPEVRRAGCAQAAVAALHEDGVRRTLHAYEAGVDAGLTAVCGGTSKGSLLWNFRAVAPFCGAAEVSLEF